MEHLPKAMIKSEGARLMAQSHPHTMTRERAQKAAKARWNPLKIAKALGIPDAEKMTKIQLDQAIDKSSNRMGLLGHPANSSDVACHLFWHRPSSDGWTMGGLLIPL